MHRSFVPTHLGGNQWIFLFITFAGSASLVTVQQPAILTAPWGWEVVLPCVIQLSSNETMSEQPVLYWSHGTRELKVWPHSERWTLLDPNKDSLNKSIRLDVVRWSDGGVYLCKMTIATNRVEARRYHGNKTSLMVHGELMFDRAGPNGSLLRCEVNVTAMPHVAFTLKICQDGNSSEVVVDAATGGAVGTEAFSTLSETVHLQENSEYECELLLQGRLITRSTFNTSGFGLQPPEPWHLYTALLLVPVIFQLIIFGVTWRTRKS